MATVFAHHSYLKNVYIFRGYEDHTLEVVGKDLAKCSTVLYVGARSLPFACSDFFRSNAHEVTVLEPWGANVRGLQEKAPWLKEVVQGDIRTLQTDKKWDAVVWIHGPEHVCRDELPGALARAENMATRLVVLACPWGENPQGVMADGNPYEMHLSHLEPEDLEALGYETHTHGEHGNAGNLLGIKHIAAANIAAATIASPNTASPNKETP